MTVLDDRWEWFEETRLCDAEPKYARGRCLHRDVVPVETLGALESVVVVACLCLTCDAQLPADYIERQQCTDCEWTYVTALHDRRVMTPCRAHRV